MVRTSNQSGCSAMLWLTFLPRMVVWPSHMLTSPPTMAHSFWFACTALAVMYMWAFSPPRLQYADQAPAPLPPLSITISVTPNSLSLEMATEAPRVLKLAEGFCPSSFT